MKVLEKEVKVRLSAVKKVKGKESLQGIYPKLKQKKCQGEQFSNFNDFPVYFSFAYFQKELFNLNILELIEDEEIKKEVQLF